VSLTLATVEDVPADAGFQYDKVSMFRYMIKSTLYASSPKTFIGTYRSLHKNYHDTGSDRKACGMLSVYAWFNLYGMQNYTNHGYCGFVLVLQANIRIYSEIRTRPLSSTFFSIRYSPSFHNLVHYV